MIHADGVLIWLQRISALVVGSIVLVITGFLVIESLPALSHVGARFVTDASWHPSPEAASGSFAIAPMLVGTVAVASGAVLLSVPVALLSAIYGAFYAPPRWAGLYRHVLQLLAGVPSVVYGLWGLVVWVPIIRRFEPPGASLLAGILILGLMILPTFALTAEAALRSVPIASLRSASSLGLSQVSTLRHVVLPSCRSGLVAALVLGMGRALGETMAVLMVCGNVARVPASVFDPVRTLTANIALEMAYAMDTHRSALFVTGLALMVLVAVLAAIAGRLYGDVRGSIRAQPSHG